MAFVLVLAIYLRITWLAALVGVGALFIVMSTVQLRRPQPVAQAAAAPRQEEILTPVIVQDVGEAPYLYPPDFRLKIKPTWNSNNMYENMGWGAAMAFRSVFRVLGGDKFQRGVGPKYGK